VLPGSGKARIDREGSDAGHFDQSVEYEDIDERRNMVVRGL
jgi:hypothetical protein